MSDYSVTSASVLPVTTGSYPTVKSFSVAGEAITKAGMPLYLHTDGKLYMAIDDTAAHAAVVGVSLHPTSAANQPIAYATGGDLTYNSIFTPGVAVYVSDTAGGLRAFADQATGDYLTVVGVPTTATNLRLTFLATGAQA